MTPRLPKFLTVTHDGDIATFTQNEEHDALQVADKLGVTLYDVALTPRAHGEPWRLGPGGFDYRVAPTGCLVRRNPAMLREIAMGRETHSVAAVYHVAIDRETAQRWARSIMTSHSASINDLIDRVFGPPTVTGPSGWQYRRNEAGRLETRFTVPNQRVDAWVQPEAIPVQDARDPKIQELLK